MDGLIDSEIVQGLAAEPWVGNLKVQLKMKEVPEEWECIHRFWVNSKVRDAEVLQACEVPAVYMQA
jgi:hypothetical protein